MIQPYDFSGIWKKSTKYSKQVCTEMRYSFGIRKNCWNMGRIECGESLNDGDLILVQMISPEKFPNCLWIGKEIEVYDGFTLAGTIIVQEIFNSKLSSN